MLKIRLARHGATKHPYYRVVAADERNRRDGRFVELLGLYDPNVDPSRVELNMERVEHWLSVGAQPTAKVRDLIRRQRREAASATP
jgi:small subunit ribosomal protein S16